MTQQVLILGGSGRIGGQVAADLLSHTAVNVTIAGRNPKTGQKACQVLVNSIGETSPQRCQFVSIHLDDLRRLQDAIAQSDLVIHCAGPFQHRNASVLKLCIDSGVNYIDVSDCVSFTCKAIALQAEAQAAGITATINTGIFPGISNSMVRRDIEQLDRADKVHLSYVVGGSGGAGLTVMRSTFLGLQRPFAAWIDGKHQQVQPYSDREAIEFPHYGKVGVYWFDMPEALTLADTFPVKTVVTKFGTVPRFYNYLTWSVARWWHPKLLQSNSAIEFLSQVSYAMTQISDRFSGVGVAIRSEVLGMKYGQLVRCCSTLHHPNTAEVAGRGTGAIAQLLLSGELRKPGVWTPEQVLSTPMFEKVMSDRDLEIHQQLLPNSIDRSFETSTAKC
ncbi:MAG: saccharopine dehydrogenase family protein [Aulosira sp. ZfuVER01]|nr:saccharopine dehydrogenase NADP-binding domain-containing protein [Aulosira sp. ZfuVER01]MDZ7996669.1 saccharopine dehydrogenase NADP-binding domain-containing protein [Aulosira sp. DedVER01a]MDZ8053719.1 saccharopine dehydrogenase NADP-binding domain-containing protein [Aulosira sp. ZfuCHP01]